MANNRYAVTAYVANPGTPYIDESGKNGNSRFGHMWLSLDDNERGLKQPYGFHPQEDRSNWPLGKVKNNKKR